MVMDIVDLYYFSGTGNTYRVARKMADIFMQRGVNIALYKIEKADPAKINPNHTIGLGFPVAVQSTYPFIWKFIMGMPDANGIKVFMVDTLEAFSGGMVGPLKRILEQKGYSPIGIDTNSLFAMGFIIISEPAEPTVAAVGSDSIVAPENTPWTQPYSSDTGAGLVEHRPP